MKKTFLGLSLLLLVTASFVSCDDDKVVPVDEIPSTSQAFLERYFEGYTITRVEREGSEYSVNLQGGIEVDFDAKGEWKEVDGADGVEIPTGFILEPIVVYVGEHYSDNKINGIEKNVTGYDVDLVRNDIDLLFDLEGTFTGVDR